MRYLRLKFEIDNPTLESFVFFALSLDEKLYDLTDDSFKASALNTYTRTMELQTIAHANFEAGIGKDATKPFIDELEWSISQDAALSKDQKALCKAQLENISVRAGESAQIARAVAGLRLVLRNYFQSIEIEIRKIIDSEPQRKSDLQELTSSFAIQAEIEGFPRRHTYHMVQKYLIAPLKYDTAIDIPSTLNKFFSAFSLQPRKFDCYFLADQTVSDYGELLNRFGLKHQRAIPTLDGLRPTETEFINSKGENQVWLAAESIEARAAAEAHAYVLSRFDAFSSVVRFFNHKVGLTLSRLSLTRECESKKTYISHEAPDPMHCWVGNFKYIESDYIELSDAIHGGHLVRDSAMRVSRAIRFHKAALLSNSAENQLIDLWAALEGLLPTPKRESVRIEYFSENVLPALTLTYPEKLFSSAYGDTLKVVKDSPQIFSKVRCNGSQFARFICLLLCAEFEAERDALLTLLKAHPLLRNKLWRLMKAFESPSAVQHTLRTHRRKVKWHLYRIYFTRNSLMHSAASMPYLSTLVENLHLYVDTLIRVIAKVAHASPETLSIEAGLQYLAGWEKLRLDGGGHQDINNQDAPVPSNVWSLVFGNEMILAPNREKEPFVDV